MEILRQLAEYPFALISNLPGHLLLAGPFIMAAWLLWLGLRRWLAVRSQVLMVSGVAALGLAPLFGAHASMAPVYVLLLAGRETGLAGLASILLTWALLFAWLRRQEPFRPSADGASPARP